MEQGPQLLLVLLPNFSTYGEPCRPDNITFSVQSQAEAAQGPIPMHWVKEMQCGNDQGIQGPLQVHSDGGGVWGDVVVVRGPLLVPRAQAGLQTGHVPFIWPAGPKGRVLLV